VDNIALIFSPHPDDAELGMGGTIVRMLKDDWEVVLVDITNGEPTPCGSVEIRSGESAKASKILGLSKRICLGLPNRYLENNLEYRRVLAETIRQFKPRWIFTVCRPDAHPDHVHAGELTEEARFTAKLTKSEMAFEPHYAEKIIYYYATHLRVHAQPSFVVDVTDQWDRKIEAVKAYQSQFWLNQSDPQKKGWIIDHIASICGYFGNRIGVKYGEPFFCHELVGLTSVNHLL